MSLIDKKFIVAASLTALCLQGCASGQGSSFATRVNSGNSSQGFADSATSNDSDSQSRFSADDRPMVLASSGNVLLPGAFSNALRGYSGNGLVFSDGAMGADQAGREVTAMLGGAVSLTRTGEAGPELSVGLGGGVTATGVTGSPLLAAISPAAQGANTLTGGMLSNTTGALGAATAPLTSGAPTAPLVTASAGGVSVAGQPLTSFAGSSSVLANAGSAAGGAVGGAGNILSGVNPGSATAAIVNAAAGEVASTVGTAASPTGLGGLTSVLPGRR